jgi:hypothetical protein
MSSTSEASLPDMSMASIVANIHLLRTHLPLGVGLLTCAGVEQAFSGEWRVRISGNWPTFRAAG